MKLSKIIGTNISNARRAKGLNQAQLGSAVGFPANTIAKWESGALNPRLHNLEKLATALEIDPLELFLGPRESNAISAMAELLSQKERQIRTLEAELARVSQALKKPAARAR